MRRPPRPRRALVGALAPLLALTLATPAEAAFPGSNGPLVIGVGEGATSVRTYQQLEEGGGPGQLGLQAGRMRSVEVSADGTRMVGQYCACGLPEPVLENGIYVATLPGGAMTRVHPDAFALARFLPDGRVLLRLSSGQLWTVAADGSDLRALVPAITLTGARDLAVSPDGRALFYARDGYPGADQLIRVDLPAGTSRSIHERGSTGGAISIKVGDVSPDGSLVAISEQTTSEPSSTEVAPPHAIRLIGATGGSARTVATAATLPKSVQFSPDGTRIAYLAENARTELMTVPVVIRTVAVTGGDERAIASFSDTHSLVSLDWAAGPSLAVDLTGGALIGDVVELDLTLRNFKETPYTGVTYASGGATGIVLNTAPYSPAFRAGYTVLGGPAPALPTQLAPRQEREHQYLLGIDTPGNVQVRAEVDATNATTGPIEVKATTYVVARNRAYLEGEEAMLVAGGYAELQGAVEQQIERALDDTTDAIATALQRTLPKAERGAARRTTATEAALAERAGLPTDAMAWLPKNAKDAAKAYLAFNRSADAASKKTIRARLGSLYNATVQVPFDYWSEQLTGDPTTTIPVGTALYDEGAYWTGRLEAGASSFATRAYKLATDRVERHAFRQAVELSVADMARKLQRVGEVAPAKARQIARVMADDPVKGGTMLGEVYGTLRAEIGLVAAEAIIVPNKAGAVRGIKSIGGRLAKFDVDLDDVGRTLRGLRAPARVDRAVDAARLGMPAGDQARWAGIVRQLEDKARKFGHDIDIRLSFRPRNPFSALIPDGAGKNMFMKGKSGTELDLLLGMDPSGLGKLVVYDAKRPANFAKLPASMRKEIDERIADMRAARKEWLDPTSNLGKARRARGVELTATVGDGNVATRIKMKIEGDTVNGTTSVRYRQLVVDGKTIVKPGQPKWVVSDYDGNAILQVDGRNLPAGVRGMLELEAMRLQREAGTTMATSFHGFTQNGFDIPASVYRKTFQFLLEGMDDEQAAKALQLYLRKYATDGQDFLKLLDSYKNGDYVIQVTRDGATAAQGL